MPRFPSSCRSAAFALLVTGLLVGSPGAADRVVAQSCADEAEPNDTAELAPTFVGDVCVSGTLPDTDQDISLWSVSAAESLLSWKFTIVGVPDTITSIHVYPINSAPDVAVDAAAEVLRVDSSATSRDPGITGDVKLPAGRYLLGISRGFPVKGGEPPTLDYRASIELQGERPAETEVEPNDVAADATPVSAEFAITGDLGGSQDAFRWSLTDEDAARSWDLAAFAPGTSVSLTLTTVEGGLMAAASTAADGWARIYDLRLPAGAYLVSLSPASVFGRTYLLTATVETSPSADAEPNNTPETAIVLDAAGPPMLGRLAADQDTDLYRLTVDAALAATQLDLVLTLDAPAARQLCLSRDRIPLQCRVGDEGEVVLSNLHLAPGEYIVTVGGDESLDAGYRLAVRDTGPVRADREVEPNDDGPRAAPFDPAVVMTGRADAHDDDYFRIRISGEPQVWRLDAEGRDLELLEWIGIDSHLIGASDLSADRTAASLWDLYLVPGDHFIRLRASGGDYRVTLTPLGPVDAEGEREPNSDQINAQAIQVGDRRIGRLPGPADVDVFRFSLSAEDHVALTLDPPADGAIGLTLASGGIDFVALKDPVAGAPLVYDARLWPGDYEITLRSDSRSVAPYALRLERLDPFLTPADLEPNDTAGLARDLPATLEVTGSGWGERGSDDWYRLPALLGDAVVEVVVQGPGSRVELSAAGRLIPLQADPDGTTFRSTSLPAGTVALLRVVATGEYQVRVASNGLPPAAPLDAAGPAQVQLELTMPTTEIAAYATIGQRLAGSLLITNEGSASASVALLAATSQHGWSVDLDTVEVVVPSGGSVSVPTDVRVPDDAWADTLVRITVAATIEGAPAGSSFVEITPRGGAPLVDPTQTWPLPDALLGGLDVASLRSGASPVGSVDPVREALLHDGEAIHGAYFGGALVNGAWTFAVDLAGDASLPVAGVILNPLAGDERLEYRPRGFELLLSEDGVTYQVALSGELTTLGVDQPFVLPAPVAARFAQLRITSTYGNTIHGDAGFAMLGEWKVIATPGSVPSSDISNIADPLRGGHVVWMDPLPLGGAASARNDLLTEDPTAWRPFLSRFDTPQWVVGFQDDRTAQVTQFEWVDPPGSVPEQRPDLVTVEVSTGSPTGPWQPLGTWQLTRAADGSVAQFVLAEPTWARFVRFAPQGPSLEDTEWAMPATLRIRERATDATYRSVLAEWGMASPSGIHELLVPAELRAIDPSVDAEDDTPETATTLPIGEVASGTVHRQRDVDWYVLEIPDDQDSLTLEVTGEDYLDVVVELIDEAGTPVALRESIAPDNRSAQYRADVVPGARYRLRIEQPPFSVVFTYDTSPSMGIYLSYVAQGLRSFANGITRGEESVMIFPFEGALLLDDWSDDPYLVQSAVENLETRGGSSAVEAGLLDAATFLGERIGTRAIVLVTDAESSTFTRATELWGRLDAIRPVLFTVHVAGAAGLGTDQMQDWAASAGGHYQYAVAHADMDRAFDRMTTRLRGPASYSTSFSTTKTDRTPGSILVSAPPGADPTAVGLGGDVAIEIILDTSGSMLDRVKGQRRIEAAKAVLDQLLTEDVPPGTPVALRILGDRRDPCGTQLAVPLGPLDPAAVKALVDRVSVVREADTPIGAAISRVAGDLPASSGTRVVLLITDAEEIWPHRDLCGLDPADALADLGELGGHARVNIVGFALSNKKAKAQMREWARLGNGSFFDAKNGDQLGEAIRSVLRAGFRVYDEAGTLVGNGTVGGEPVALEPATYRVEVLTSPPLVYEAVVVGSGEGVVLTLGIDPAS